MTPEAVGLLLLAEGVIAGVAGYVWGFHRGRLKTLRLWADSIGPRDDAFYATTAAPTETDPKALLSFHAVGTQQGRARGPASPTRDRTVRERNSNDAI